MATTTKKTENTLHIGKTIRKKLEEIGMTKSEFARRIDTSPQNIYGIFKRKSIDTDMLKIISACLNFDMFQYYSSSTNVSADGVMRTSADMQKEIDELKSSNTALTNENGYLKEIYKLQKNRPNPAPDEANKNFVVANIMSMLPNIDDAGVIAVNVSSKVKPKLTAQQQAFFVAGFQECVKYFKNKITK